MENKKNESVNVPVTKELVDNNVKYAKIRESLTQSWAFIASVCLSEGIDMPITFRRGFKTIFEAYCEKNPMNYEV